MSRPEAAEPPVFAEPWQAQLFGMVALAQDRGLFSAEEWAQTLAAEIEAELARGGCRDGSDYYERCLAAFEELLERRGVATHSGLDELAASWRRAAEATPHGKPILLENDPLAAASRAISS